MDQHYQNNNNIYSSNDQSNSASGSSSSNNQWNNNDNDQRGGGNENNQNDQWHHHDSGPSPSVPPGVPTHIPSSYEHPNDTSVSPAVLIALGILGAIAVIAGIAIFVCCRKRKNEHKKEVMANAYLEFSQSQASHVFTRNKSNVPVKETEEKYTY